jgi:hypothetical protein
MWMRQCDIGVEGATATMLVLRHILIDVADFDPRREPVPFHGRSPELDLVNLAAYLGGLVARASAAAQCTPGVLAEWVTQIANGVAQPPVRAAG